MTYTALSRNPASRPAALPDLRGWDVRSDAGERLGRVGDAILDDANTDGAPRVRWLEVEAGGFFNPRRVLLPLEHAAPDESARVVRLRGIGRHQFKNLPEYPGHPADIGWLLESQIQRACSAPDEAALDGSPDGVASELEDEDFPSAEERGERAVPVARADERARADAGPEGGEQRQSPRGSRAAAPRPRDDARSAGALAAADLGVRTTRGTEQVRVPVTRYREEVVVERRAVTGVDAEHARPTIDGDEIRIPLIEEEIVIQRRAVVREEIVIRKTRVAETTEIEAEVRRDRVEMDPGGMR